MHRTASLALAPACIMVSWAAHQTCGHLEMSLAGASEFSQPCPAMPACQGSAMAATSCFPVSPLPKGEQAGPGQAEAGVSQASTRRQAMPWTLHTPKPCRPRRPPRWIRAVPSIVHTRTLRQVTWHGAFHVLRKTATLPVVTVTPSPGSPGKPRLRRVPRNVQTASLRHQQTLDPSLSSLMLVSHFRSSLNRTGMGSASAQPNTRRQARCPGCGPLSRSLDNPSIAPQQESPDLGRLTAPLPRTHPRRCPLPPMCFGTGLSCCTSWRPALRTLGSSPP